MRTELAEIVDLMNTFLIIGLVTYAAPNVGAVLTCVLVWLVELIRTVRMLWVTRMVVFVCTNPRLSARLFLAWLTQKQACETDSAQAHRTDAKLIGVSVAHSGKCKNLTFQSSTSASFAGDLITCAGNGLWEGKTSMEVVPDGAWITSSPKTTAASSCGTLTALEEEAQFL